MPDPLIAYTCECCARVETGHALYLVTGHDGVQVVCAYCTDCARLAKLDWNGETATIEPFVAPLEAT